MEDTQHIVETSEKTIFIRVNGMENIRVKDFPFDMCIDVKYGNKCLATVSSMLVEKESVTVDLNASLIIDVGDIDQVNELTGTPVIFDIAETSGQGRKSIKNGKTKFGGRCFLDLLPLLLGETSIADQPLIVDVNPYQIGQQMVPWTHLPLLHVAVKVDEPLIPKETLEESNILFFTLESIYNIPPAMPENFTFKAGIEVPKDEAYQEIYFNNGMLHITKDKENWKHWHGIPYLPGRNAITKQRVSEDNHEIRNYTENEINFHTLLKEDAPHVRWNTLKRCFLTKDTTGKFIEMIFKHNCLPMEFLVESLEENANEKATSKKSKEPEPTAILHLISYLDLSPLLYPGVGRIRLASPISNFDESEYKEKSLRGNKVFDVIIDSPEPPPTIPEKGKSEKSKPKKAQAKNEKPAFTPHALLEGQLFVIVEVELLRPLILEPPLSQIKEKIQVMIPERSFTIKRIRSKKDIKEQFRDAIKNVHGLMQSEFCNYMRRLAETPDEGCPKPFPTGQDLLPYFTDYLKSSGSDLLIQETLKKQVINICRVRLRDKLEGGTMLDIMRELQDILIFTTSEMHQTIDSHFEGQPFRSNPSKEYVNSDMMAYFAFEALEDEDFEEGKKWLLERLRRCDTDYEAWLDLALYHLRLGEIDEAMVSVEKVIALQRKHFLGFLLYAMILTEKENYPDAKMFFQTLIRLYDDYREVWVAFNAFYIIIEDKVGQDESRRRAFKSQRTAFHWPIRQYLLTSWRDMKDLASPFLQAASLFLKINCYKFAEMALAQEIAHAQNLESTGYIYYSAVLSFLKGDYKDAKSQVEKLIPESKDYPPWCLAGQIYYKLGLDKQAFNAMRCALQCYNPPPEFHMLYLRLGEFYNYQQNYNLAAEMFINASRFYGTPYSWRQAGQAAYESGDYKAAELSLSESNVLDKYDPSTWALLALVNISLRQKEKFKFCYRQAIMLGMA
ncbi:cilia- and flagella-associated protein 70-like isoform X2 [Ischnura elegans]|uniref:cilia- and flagella-associated protein 70-like isoform X2 n=1 Tax=Ischnura elegans TaxID=197161 RepID=UPI001ED8B9D6|nr:cilia- and flagella-associated protein 70-like isoform X2 [Ischnura elegans]